MIIARRSGTTAAKPVVIARYRESPSGAPPMGGAPVSTKNRRHSVSCYSWPGLHPKECMELYGNQLRTILRMLIEKGGVQHINPRGMYFERAIARAMLSRWEGSEKSEFIRTAEQRTEKRNEE
ncbi:MAG: hypothetical protein ACXW4Q_15655 [Anaerolineales bacterium]